MPTVKAEALERGIADIFRACGVPEEEAHIVAGHLVDAEACGVVSHGIIRVPQYVQAIADGQVVPDAKLRMVSETTATAAFDGGHGFGQVMACRAVDWAVERALQTGVSAATLCNCSHTGRLGSYTERAARRGLAALMMVNTGGHGQWVAPFGGTTGRLATNPISIAVPQLVLDFATSVVPEGKVRALEMAGQPVPEGWIIDHQGLPATDPAGLYGPPRGTLLPFGAHKGFGLALLIDALAGGLSGAGCCTDAGTPMAGTTDGVFLVVVKIDAFTALPEFQRTMEALIRHVKSSTPAPGFSEVLVPGEREARTRRHRLAAGISLEPAAWKALEQILERFRVTIEVT